MAYPKRSQYKYAKFRYRVQNWAQYEAGLQIRRALTFHPLPQSSSTNSMRASAATRALVLTCSRGVSSPTS